MGKHNENLVKTLQWGLANEIKHQSALSEHNQYLNIFLQVLLPWIWATNGCDLNLRPSEDGKSLQELREQNGPCCLGGKGGWVCSVTSVKHSDSSHFCMSMSSSMWKMVESLFEGVTLPCDGACAAAGKHGWLHSALLKHVLAFTLHQRLNN